MKKKLFLELSLIAAVTVFLYWKYSSWSYDDPYITYRYAQNLVSGNGFVYNLNERVLSTTTPLFALILSAFGLFFSDFPRIAVFLGCTSLAVSGWLLHLYFEDMKLPVAGWVGFAILPLFPLAGSTLGSETPLYIALLLGGVLSYTRRNYVLTAVLCALLGFTRPDGVLLAAVLGIHYLAFVREKIPWKAVMLYAALNLVWWGGIWIYFGSPIPVTLYTKHQQGVMDISQKFAPGLITIARSYGKKVIYWLMAVAAGFGVVSLAKRKSQDLLVVVWTVVYFAAYTALGVTRYFWYYAPLLPGLVFLVGLGIQWIFETVKRLIQQNHNSWKLVRLLGTVCLITIIGLEARDTSLNAGNPDKRIDIYRAAGEWLYTHTPASSSVGSLEIGMIGYYARRTMIDFAGLLQPDVASQMENTSNYQDTAAWAIDRYHPDYLVMVRGDFPEIEAEIGPICSERASFLADQYEARSDVLIYDCTDAWEKN